MVRNNIFYRDFSKSYGIGWIDITNDLRLQTKFLVEDIKYNFTKGESVLIYDWGGGNGLVSVFLLNSLKEYDLRFVIIDLDDSKFIKHPKIKNVKADISKFKPKKKADYSVSRNILHYNTREKIKKFLFNTYRSTKKDLLLINVVYPENEKEIWRNLQNKLYEWFGIYRNYLTFEEMEKLINNSKWKISKAYKEITYNYDALNFFKKRFKLNGKQVEELKEVGVEKINKHYNLILFCSK